MRPDVLLKRQVFCAEVMDVPHEKLVYLDEMGVNLAMTPTLGRAPVGERAVCSVPGNRGANVSVIAAVRNDAVVGWYPHDGAVDAERCTAFVHRLLLKEGDVVVMDNVRFHHSDSVKKAIQSYGARILFIPPYHPELDAIEEVFSKVKRSVRRLEPRTICSLIQALTSSFACVSKENLDAFVKHALWFAKQFLAQFIPETIQFN